MATTKSRARRPKRPPPPPLPAPSELPDYGLDAPRVVYGFGWGGIVLLTLAVLIAAVGAASLQPVRIVAATAFAIGIAFVFAAMAMIAGSRRGKLAMRDRVLDALALDGDERVLDVGCGRGLMLLGAATRLTSGGRVVGVAAPDRAGAAAPLRPVALENARRAGVADRVGIAVGNLHHLPFPDASFDLVVSGLSLHDLPDTAARAAAVAEMARVVRPGGRVVIADVARTAEYVAALRTAGASTVLRSPPRAWMVPPVRVVLARR